MFSTNNKISKRQMFRLLTYDILGIGTLLLPSALSAETGKNGMLAILLGMGAGLCYCILIGWQVNAMKEEESYPAYLKRCFGSFLGTVAILFYVCYYLCLGGYVSYIFGHLMITELLKEQSFYWIVAGLLLLAVYGIFQGIEGRARVYEILFWFLMAPLFLMMFFAARDVEVFRLFPLYETGFPGVLKGSLFSFEVFSLVGIGMFLPPFAQKKESIRGACVAAVLFGGCILLVLYGILQGIFGTKSIADLEYPAVTLMSMIQIPGGFFQRQDAIMVAVWFFTMYALLSSSMFYTAENLKEFTKGKKEKVWIVITAAAVFGISICSYRSAGFTEGLNQIFLSAATPAVVLLPLLATLCIKYKKDGRSKKVIQGMFLLAGMMLLSGCSTAELENRKFPLAMGIDKREESCQISYKFQDLSAIADENANSSGGTDFFIEDQDFFTGISKYANETNKIMDYNHMKVLILSEDFAEDRDSLENFLEICKKESLIARNTLLFFAKDAAEILALDQNLDTAIGSYLEEMIESREDYKLKDAVTLGDLYNDLENKEQLLLVPVLHSVGNLPVIRNYYAVSGGVLKGEISIQEAVLSYLIQGKLKKLSFSLDEKTPVSIQRIRVKRDFFKRNPILYHNKITLEVVVENDIDTAGKEGKEVKENLEKLFQKELKKSGGDLLTAPGIDLANSFCRLGMQDRTLYEQYKNNPEEYIRNLKYDFKIEVILLNEQK